LQWWEHRTTDGSDALKALSWEEVRRIVGKFGKLNPYNPKIVPSSILNIVEEMNFDLAGRQRQLNGYGISAKRYSLYVQDRQTIRLITVSEHGLGLYYRPKEGRDSDCEVALWMAVDSEPGAGNPRQKAGLVERSSHEAYRDHDPQCDGRASQA
jgi:hypothetical protein